jgi:hypothetical protein
MGVSPGVTFGYELREAGVAVLADVLQDGSRDEVAAQYEQHNEAKDGYGAALRDVEANQLAHRCSLKVLWGEGFTPVPLPGGDWRAGFSSIRRP